MKYIDADRLKAKIERMAKSIDNAIGDFAEGRRLEQRIILSFIASLQQEQPEIKSYIEKLLKECAGKDGEYERGRRETLAHLFAYLSGNPLEYILQPVKQPEVDLGKEIKIERAILLDDAFGPMNGEQSLAIRNFARHFYKLGLNARKEEL